MTTCVFLNRQVSYNSLLLDENGNLTVETEEVIKNLVEDQRKRFLSLRKLLLSKKKIVIFFALEHYNLFKLLTHSVPGVVLRKTIQSRSLSPMWNISRDVEEDFIESCPSVRKVQQGMAPIHDVIQGIPIYYLC